MDDSTPGQGALTERQGPCGREGRSASPHRTRQLRHARRRRTRRPFPVNTAPLAANGRSSRAPDNQSPIGTRAGPTGWQSTGVDLNKPRAQKCGIYLSPRRWNAGMDRIGFTPGARADSRSAGLGPVPDAAGPGRCRGSCLLGCATASLCRVAEWLAVDVQCESSAGGDHGVAARLRTSAAVGVAFA